MIELKLANLEELRDRYDFADILAYFKSGELVAWCEKNGHSDETTLCDIKYTLIPKG